MKGMTFTLNEQEECQTEGYKLGWRERRGKDGIKFGQKQRIEGKMDGMTDGRKGGQKMG